MVHTLVTDTSLEVEAALASDGGSSPERPPTLQVLSSFDENPSDDTEKRVFASALYPYNLLHRPPTLQVLSSFDENPSDDTEKRVFANALYPYNLLHRPPTLQVLLLHQDAQTLHLVQECGQNILTTSIYSQPVRQDVQWKWRSEELTLQEEAQTHQRPPTLQVLSSIDENPSDDTEKRVFASALYPYNLLHVNHTVTSSEITNSPSPDSNGYHCTQRESSSLTYVVDTTGSMSDDFAQLKVVNSWLLDRVTAKFPCGVRQYTMVEFNDPDVGPVRFTESREEFGAFFNNLEARDGGDCPELAITGIEQALLHSTHQSFILVLTDASAKDYANATLVNQVFSLIKTTGAQVFFLITGMCGSEDSPDYTIYRDIASLSFGHVFTIPLSDLNKVFNYLDFTLSIPVNSSELLFSGDFTDLVHNESLSVSDTFSSLMITTDGVINSLRLVGPNNLVRRLAVLVTERWGSMQLMNNPAIGNYIIIINAGGRHAVRVQGFMATNISSTGNCSECHPDALCEEYADSVKCSCKDGFIGDGFNCSDINECEYEWTHRCSVGICQNTLGSYFCICPSGYNNTGDACVPFSMCDNPGLNRCHSLATCIPSSGDYSCVCPTGYYGNGFHCEVDECQRGVCGFRMDCTKSIGSYFCSDPCANHTVLDEPWRSTDYTGTVTKNCDGSKNGWYQFVGSSGVRMPETCVPERRCNTDAPVWMSGTHPAIRDGIVDRTACAAWGGTCCQWTSTIQVKACQGGYYVYKLIGTPGSVCTLSYCTDPLTANGTCKADEEWRLSDKGWGCYCKDQYKVSGMYDGIEDVAPAVTLLHG
ncbi:uncharacterized protein ACMZJ9_009832 [Mantella aurantiaca]